MKSDLIRIFILDKQTKAMKPVNADSILIRRNDAFFTLDAEDPDEQGRAAVYSLDNKDLAIAMNLGVTLELVIGDKTYVADIAAHSHSHSH